MKNSLDIASISPLKTPVEATVSVPGSKSYSLRAMAIDYLAGGNTKLVNCLESDDTRAMQGALEALKSGENKIFVHESGLTARFLTAIACITSGEQIIYGKPGLNKRPIDELVKALRSLGAKIEYTEKEGFPPVRILSSELNGHFVSISGSISSQFVSALMIIAPFLENGLEISVEGEIISKPYIEMTSLVMHKFGILVEEFSEGKYKIPGEGYKPPKEFFIEIDFSSASYFKAIEYLTGTKIDIQGYKPDSSLQADSLFLALLRDGKIKKNVKQQHFDVSYFPDQAMTMAVLAAFAAGKTVIDGVASLRIKETERVQAVQNELAKMGIKTESSKDTLTILGGKPHATAIDTYGDHRIAMSFAVAGTKIPGIKIINPGVVNKTFPAFWDELAKVATIKRTKKEFSNILLIGMRGSGKTTTGRLLADKFAKDFIDMDLYLEEKYGKKVRDIVLAQGWEHFRKLEAKACKELSKRTNCVISSGGGIVLDQDNMELFKPNSVSILLRADAALLSKRIKNDKNRPELSTQPSLLGELDEVWEGRKEKYYQNADFIIDTGNISPNQAVDAIMEKLS